MAMAILCRIGRVGALIVALTALPAYAHDSPEHEVEHLTEQMQRRGATAPLLFRRACEYRVLGQLERASSDLERALKLDASHVDARAELARIQLAEHQPAEALATIDAALAQVRQPDRRPPLWMIRSDVATAQERYADALADCKSAVKERPDQIDWLLKRSLLQAKLARHDERIRDLAAAYAQTQSGVLKIEQIEALLDAKQFQWALEQIEKELAASRWQSAWLVRRARALAGLGHGEAAAEDLRAAISEINRRLSPARPDVTLLVDRGLAWGLLGDRPAAEKDLQAARKLHADGWLVGRLESVVAAESKNP